MTLSAGSRLGPYEILSPLGAGGMGEVYKARDTRLERTVAVKVLPSHMSASAEVRQRFEREAKTISQLSHPHICALYDVGREGETEYLVMELLEGETLSDRLAKGPLPLEQTLRYGVEIADALDKAHRQGIVHRDLKPGNVMLTKSGVKLLDFGLAKAMAPAAEKSSLTSLPTQPGLTQEGTILGTFQYMAPEQLEGKDADARTDIFALGAVVYEMATGRKAFAGASQASLISAIMTTDPPVISSVQPMSPIALDRVVQKCVAKDPEDRWQSARDMASELAWIRDGESPQAAGGLPRKHAWVPWMLSAGLAAALAASILLASRAPKAETAGTFRFEVAAPPGTVLDDLDPVGTFLSLSPDGRRLAFVAASTSNGIRQIWVRPLNSLVAQVVPGTEDGSSPFWSPDGASLAFFADGKLKRISLSGGPAVTVCEAPRGSAGTWGSQGTIVFSDWGSAPTPLFRVSALGGEPVAATRLDVAKGERWHEWPVFLPDGGRFLYLSQAGESWPKDRRSIFLGTLGSLDARFVAASKSEFAYSFPGFLLFANEGALFAQRFDADSATIHGEPRLIVPDIQTYLPTGVATVAASNRTPTIALYTGGADSRLVWLDRTGREVGTLRASDRYLPRGLRLSPDGKRLVFASFDRHLGTTDLWVQDLEKGTATRVTFDPWSEFYPVWSSDGGRIFFSADVGGQPPDLFQVGLADPKTEPLAHGSGPMTASDVSPDGRYLLYEERRGERVDILTLPLTGERKPVPFLSTPFDESQARFSPEGRFVAYVSSESGKLEVYVRRFPEGPERWQVSRAGGISPRWSRSGNEIYFVSEGRVMAASVHLGRTFESASPTPLFAADFVSGADYEVAPDGRFLVRVAVAHPPGIQIVANWTSELKP